MKKLLACLLMLAVATAVIAAPQKEGASSGEPKVIRMWTFLNPNGENLKDRNLALRKIIDNFKSLNTGIDVQVEPQQWDIMTAKFLAAHQAGNAPDVAWVIMDEMGSVRKQGALADLEGLFLSKWNAEDKEDVKDSLWEYGAAEGKHYQVSHSRNLQVIFYRKDLFAQKGIKTPLRTWDELIDAAKKLTEDDPKLGIKRWGFGQAFLTGKVDPPLFIPMMLTRQDSPFAADGKAKWATEAGVQGMQLVVDMVKKHQITPPTCTTASAEDLYAEFLAGKYAMITGGGVRMSRLRGEASKFGPNDVGLMLTPSWDGKGYSPAPIQGWCVGIWSKSKVRAEASKFLEFMSNQESDKLWVLNGGQIPVRKSTVKALADFFAKPENEYITTLAEGVSKSSWAPPADFSIAGWREETCKAIQDTLVNGTPVAEALKKAEAEFNRKH